MAELKPYTPTLRDRIRGGARALGGVLGPTTAERWGQTAQTMADYVPLVGGALSMEDAKRSAQAGNYGTAAMQGVLGGLDFIPVFGAPIKAASKIRAFHGSPHKFDRFDLNKLGTGEGAQIKGRGHYLAEEPTVTGKYKHMALAPGTKIPSKVSKALDKLDWLGFDTKSDAVAHIKNDANWKQTWDVPEDNSSKVIDEWLNEKGYKYTVDIRAEKNSFIDWDKPIEAQSGKVKRAFKRLNVKNMDHALALAKTDRGAMLFRNNDIVGARFFDAGSRGAGKGTKNYVVWDDTILDIIP